MKSKKSVLCVLFISILYTDFSAYSQKWKIFTDEYHIYSVIQAEDAAIWALTSKGILNYDKSGKIIKSHTIENGLPSNLVTCIFQDRSNNLWAGTEDGIYIFDGKKWNNILVKNIVVQKVVSVIEVNTEVIKNKQNISEPGPEYSPSKKPNKFRIRKIFQDRKGSYWFCTSGRGILKYENEKWYNYLDKDKDKLIDYINCVTQDKDDILWFGTSSGIIRFDGKEWNHIDVPNKNSNNSNIKSICEEKEGRIFFGTDEGLFKYVKNEVKIINQYLQINDITYNKINDELWACEWIVGIHIYKGNEVKRLQSYNGTLPISNPNCLFQDEEGSIWLGGYGGLAKLDGTIWGK